MYFRGVENRLHLIKTANKLGLSLFFNIITKMYDSRNDVVITQTRVSYLKHANFQSLGKMLS